MEIIEITGKTMGVNGRGEKVGAGLFGPRGVWPIDEAGRMVFYGRAVFLYQGKRLLDLDELPEILPA
jgi:hypothetical protein